jgi:hypothetical protein
MLKLLFTAFLAPFEHMEACPRRAGAGVAVSEAGRTLGKFMANPSSRPAQSTIPTNWVAIAKRSCFVSVLTHKQQSSERLFSSPLDPLPSHPHSPLPSPAPRQHFRASIQLYLVCISSCLLACPAMPTSDCRPDRLLQTDCPCRRPQQRQSYSILICTSLACL